MCVATVFLMATTQAAPKAFLPAKYVGVKIGGLRTQRWLMVPMSSVTMLYAASAEQIALGNPVRGHVGGYSISIIAFLLCVYARKFSNVFWGIGFAYMMFGQLHHGRKLTQLTDGASWYNTGDWAVMREYRRLAKQRRFGAAQ
jgi:hypothetical protein